MSGRLAGRVCLVTGAAGGIGEATCEAFAEEGALVVATDLDAPRTPAGGASHSLDVRSETDWNQVCDRVLADFGRIDVLVNNAGIVRHDALAATSLATWQDVIAVNQTGTFMGMRTVIPFMLLRRAGAVVNVSSIWGSVGAAGAAAYQASKGAVRNLTKNAAVTYAPDRIRVNSVHPGFIDTGMTRAQPSDMNASIVAATPLGRAGLPEEVARACLFLASDESSFVTGAELNVDGGYLAQ